MLDSDDSAESVMSLDLSCRSDGLLVGFGARSPLQRSPDESERGQDTALLSSTSQRKAGWGRLFRRTTSNAKMEEKSLLHKSTNGDPQYYRDDDGEEYDDGYGFIRDSPAPFQDKPFQQEENDFSASLEHNNKKNEKFRDSTNIKSNSYRDGAASSGRYPNDSNNPPQWQSQSFSELPGRAGGGRGGMQGFGNCDPRREAGEGFGSFFKRLYDRQEERQAMRIATEGTMEEPSWEKNLGRAAAVLLAPELCDDPDEDLDRLAMYRTIGTDVEDDDDDEECDEQNEWNNSKPSDTAKWKVEAQRLMVYAEKLEKELKIRGMELMSWKQRAKELQQELRKATSREEEDSTEGHDSDEEGDSDDEQEEETGDDSDNKISEGDLLGLASESVYAEPNKESSTSDFDTSMKECKSDYKDEPTEVVTQLLPDHPGLLLQADAGEKPKSKPMAFDPLTTQETHQPSVSTELALIPTNTTSEIVLQTVVATN